ncbi:cytosine deaminase [Actinomadura sp. KC216]|uniref:amidohydrolase family protein n=1 Tax=Actinomadura sp. KC216 TaxID=2530370 RepID=UPI001045441B|nr:amidohydrolase family protein [Actinomadura sp. KC216]TDB82205.1 cytosine deaminase [Actinomadura sp. KC216]
MPPEGLLLRGATLADGSRADVRVSGDLIAEVAPPGRAAARPGEAVADLDGHVLLPAPAEPHAHLDKTLTADDVPVPNADLPAAVAAWREHRGTLTTEDIARRARRAALLGLSYGVTAIRTHADVGPGIELRAVEALVTVRGELRGLVDIQVVAMANSFTGEGRESPYRLRDALALGADMLGGAPHIDEDPARHLRTVMSLAAEHGVPVDLHMDEHLGEALDLPALAHLAGSPGAPPAVTASHCVSLGMRTPTVQEEVSRTVAAAGVGVVVCPPTNLYLQARDLQTGTPRGIAPVGELLRAGVRVAAGGDNVQDPFNPLGRCDPLQTAQLLVMAGHLTVDQAYHLVSDGARQVMGLPPARIEPGSRAELLAVVAGSLREALATTTEARTVIRGPRIVRRTRVLRDP